MIRKLQPVFASVLVFLLTCCVNDKPDVGPNISVKADTSTGVYITNEGNYQKGNASVSYCDFNTGKVTDDAYAAANGRGIGDVCQSMRIFNGKGYVVVNNSGKVEVVNPQNFQSIGVIKGLTSPRYFAGINIAKAYVTDLYSNAISVIDLNSNTKVKDISCGGETEELLVSGNKAYVTNGGGKYLYIVNVLTDAMEDSIAVGDKPSSIQLDKNGKLWVLCGGRNDNKTIPGSLYRIDPVTKTIEMTLTFPFSSLDSPWKLRINGTADTLYYLFQGVYRMSVNDQALPKAVFIPQNNTYFYGLGLDPNSGIIYVADAVDYVQKGKVHRYQPDGTLINSFNVGIIPGDFCFY